MKLEYELATVTPSGLLFNSLYYSSAALMKMQCFSHANNQGTWRIPIMYDQHNSRHIVLLDFIHFELASTIDNPIDLDPLIIEAYQEAIRNLKLRLTMKRNQ